MKKIIQRNRSSKDSSRDLFERIREDSWTYIKTVVDVIHEPVLILDKKLRVIAANHPFYKTFQVEPKDTEKKVVYELGNGQWNIPSLRKLLEEILPKNTFFRSFEVAHDFPWIGRKVMLLNARQIYFKNDSTFPPIILLAIEDMTEMMSVADKLTNHVSLLEKRLILRTDKVEIEIGKLEREMEKLRRK